MSRAAPRRAIKASESFSFRLDRIVLPKSFAREMPMKLNRSPRVAIISFTFLLFLTLVGLDTLQADARPKRGRAAAGRGRAASRKIARGAKLSRRERRELARGGRRGGRAHLSKREMR